MVLPIQITVAVFTVNQIYKTEMIESRPLDGTNWGAYMVSETPDHH